MEIVNGQDYLDQIRGMITQYVKWLNRDLSFQNLEDELSHLSTKYAPPEGELLAAVENGVAYGMVAYYRHSGTRCEMKRLYVAPEMRGQNLGDALVKEIISRARAAGYREMVLDTLQPLKAAVRLYEKHGFRRCAPYYRNPFADVIYMRLDL